MLHIFIAHNFWNQCLLKDAMLTNIHTHLEIFSHTTLTNKCDLLNNLKHSENNLSFRLNFKFTLITRLRVKHSNPHQLQ